MGIAYNTSQVTDGLVFAIDAANPRSYSGSGITVNGLVSGLGGTLINGAGFTSTNSGSFVFDGTNDYMYLPAISQNNGASQLTWCAWMKRSASNSLMTLMQFANNNNDISCLVLFRYKTKFE